MTNLPSGTATFLFTDIEGSTKFAQQYPDAMPVLLARHNEILNQCIEAHNGFIFRVVGDSYSASFHNANDASLAALDAQQNLHNEPWSAIARPNGRNGIGAKNHCAHGKGLTEKFVLDWRPFEYATCQSVISGSEHRGVYIFTRREEGKQTYVEIRIKIFHPKRYDSPVSHRQNDGRQGKAVSHLFRKHKIFDGNKLIASPAITAR